MDAARSYSSPNERFVPWEPYKAATSAEIKPDLNHPFIPTNLVPYNLSCDIPSGCKPEWLIERFENEFVKSNGVQLSKQKAAVKKKDDPSPEEITQAELVNEIKILKKELDVERGINSELKKLLVHTLHSDDVNCKMASLAEDKVRLAKNIDVYYESAQGEQEQREQLKIENSLWMSKFMAIAIRADDLAYSLHQALGLFKRAQNIIGQLSQSGTNMTNEITSAVADMLKIDVVTLYKKSPCCDEGRSRKEPFTSSITIISPSNVAFFVFCSLFGRFAKIKLHFISLARERKASISKYNITTAKYSFSS